MTMPDKHASKLPSRRKANSCTYVSMASGKGIQLTHSVNGDSMLLACPPFADPMPCGDDVPRLLLSASPVSRLSPPSSPVRLVGYGHSGFSGPASSADTNELSVLRAAGSSIHRRCPD